MNAEPVDAITVPTGGGRSIDDLLRDVSASRLATFHQCRLKFYFRYVVGLTRPKSPALHVGTSVHAVLKAWNRARWRGQQPSLKELHDTYSKLWGEIEEPIQWGGEEDEQKKTGWRLLETYFRESPIPGDEKPEAVEVSVEADLTSHSLPGLVGIIDLVRPGGRIVDFKTFGKTPDPEQAGHLYETQTTAYAVLYRQAAGKMESGIELHHLVKTKNPKLVVSVFGPATESQVTRLYRLMESYVAGLQREDFIPSPGLQCASCEFFAACRAWH
jgi:putative RecB family exonuclease